jgi:DNA-binding CsgD family transcriptional regulator
VTEREVEVVRLITGGYSNREIAHALGTAERTLKNHVSSILAKLGVCDSTRAVLKALESYTGIVTWGRRVITRRSRLRATRSRWGQGAMRTREDDIAEAIWFPILDVINR